MGDVLKSLGIYKAVNASAVQFNSIVFRVVVGFLAGVPAEIIALIPAIEFILNFLLEVPAGYLADKYGRVPFAIIGHITVILGLTCGYVALLLAPKWLRILDRYWSTDLVEPAYERMDMVREPT